MEFTHGDSLESISLDDDPSIIPNLAKELYALSTAQLPNYPGPRARGKPDGYLFSEAGAEKPLDSDKLNAFQLSLNAYSLGLKVRFSARRIRLLSHGSG